VQRLLRGYTLTIASLAAATVAASIIIMSLQVFYRYFLSSSLIWAEEVCRYLMVWMSFFFAGAAFQRGEMVGFEFLARRLPRRVKAFMLAPAYLVCVGFLGVLAYYGWLFAEQNSVQAIPAADFIWQSLAGRDSGISIFWVYVSVPAGCVLLAAHMLARAVLLLLGRE
jgi:TRAP-type C4-dicarboxylate transport system permease small subunit